MKTIELSEKTFKKLTKLKEHMKMKGILEEDTFDKMLSDLIDMIWHEQATGEVAYMT